MAATGAAADARRQQQAVFKAKYAELLAEARGVALDFRVNVNTVAFLPAGGGGGGRAVMHEFRGTTRDARMAGSIQQAVARDVSAMGMEEVAKHERQLRNFRAVVERALQAKAAAAGGVKRAPPEQQLEAAATGAGDSKMSRILIE
jgi:hypothetical protein